MLEGIPIVRHVIVVVVWIGKEVVTRGKHIARRQVRRRQMGLAGILDHKDFLRFVGQVLAQFIAQIGVGIAVAHYLHGVVGTYRAMIGGDDDTIVGLSQLTEQVGYDRMAEPRQGDASVGRLVVGQLTHHLRLRTGMTEHVDEIEHYHVQVVLAQRVQLLHKPVGILRRIDFMVRKGVLPTIPFQLRLNQRFLVQVLAFFFVLVDPQVGKHLGNLLGHQSREDSVTGILRGRGEYRTIHVLINLKLVAQLALQHLPLVIAEIIEHHQEHFFAFVQSGEYAGFKQLVRHHRMLLTLHPVHIVLLHVFGKTAIGLFLLHLQHLGHL